MILYTQFIGRIAVEPAISATVTEAVISQNTQNTAVSCGERRRSNAGSCVKAVISRIRSSSQFQLISFPSPVSAAE